MVAALAAAQRLLAAGVLAWGAWWTLLALLALVPPRRRVHAAAPPLRLTVIVPAHNEEALVARTVDSLRATSMTPRPEVLVVADNCTDATAAVASAAGATVLERHDLERRGKSFALDFAIEHLRARDLPPDAVVVVDADTTVAPGFFEAIASRLATGSKVVQAHYAASPAETDLGRLRRLALGLVHWTRPLGAARLGLPTTLKGNGMAFAWAVARDGLPGAGITEDAASTIELARASVVADFEPAARVQGAMASRYEAARTQDLRWEGGRASLLPAALSCAAGALRRGDLRAAAAAAEVASPPLTLAGAAAMMTLAMGLAGLGSARLGLASAASLCAYVTLGLAATRPERRDLVALATAPRFVAHKLRIYADLASGGGRREWERTDRG
jgi:hypothetical protein